MGTDGEKQQGGAPAPLAWALISWRTERRHRHATAERGKLHFAKRCAREVGSSIWARRQEFFPPCLSSSEAAAKAIRILEGDAADAAAACSKPVVINEGSDNCGGFEEVRGRHDTVHKGLMHGVSSFKVWQLRQIELFNSFTDHRQAHPSRPRGRTRRRSKEQRVRT